MRSGKGLPARFLDDGQNSPSLFRLLSGDAVDETCRVRLWVEQRGDGGFWETEGGGGVARLSRMPRRRRQRQKKEMGVPIEPSSDGSGCSDDSGSGAGDADGSWVSWSPSTQPAPKDNYAGVRLSRTADVSAFHQQSTLAWESASDESAPPTVASPVSEGDSGDEEGAAADGTNGDEQKMPPEERILVFVKSLVLGNEESQSMAGTWRGGDANHYGGGAAATPPLPKYLTHAALRASSPLRSLFELAAAEHDTAVAPEDLEAYVEDLPWVWQSAVVATDPETNNAETEEEPSGGRPAAARRGGAQNKRFFLCPPPLPSPGGPHPSRGGGVAAMAAAAVAGQREKGDGDVGVTLEGAGLSSGASICFFRAGDRSAVRRTYNTAIEGLLEEMKTLLRGEGPLGRVHLIKVKVVVGSLILLAGNFVGMLDIFMLLTVLNGRGSLVFVSGSGVDMLAAAAGIAASDLAAFLCGKVAPLTGTGYHRAVFLNRGHEMVWPRASLCRKRSHEMIVRRADCIHSQVVCIESAVDQTLDSPSMADVHPSKRDETVRTCLPPLLLPYPNQT